MTHEVLVVEDEPMIRLVAVEAFEDAGFVVHEAGSALEAIGILSIRPGIDALFTDVNLGEGPSGIDLADLVSSRYSHAAIVITSGRCHFDLAKLPTAARFLPKPYRLDAVIDAVLQLLDALPRRLGSRGK